MGSEPQITDMARLVQGDPLAARLASVTRERDALREREQGIADLLRTCEFAMSHARTALVAFVDRTQVGAVSRDFDRLGEVVKAVNAALVDLPPAEPMTPEREEVLGRFVAAVLDKRFGEGSQEAVDEAARAAWITARARPTESEGNSDG